MLLEEVENYLIDKHDAEAWPSLEGDDLLSMWQTTDTVVVSKDKDMLTIPGRVLIIPHMKTTDKLKPKKISPREAADFLFIQVLTGDPVDNYAGAPGIGVGKAAEFLNGYQLGNYKTRWEAIITAYEWAWEKRPRWHHLWVHPESPYEEALMNMRCARLLKDEDYKPVVGGSVGLWLPEGKREWI
jgi:5'-3' exonuclease